MIYPRQVRLGRIRRCPAASSWSPPTGPGGARLGAGESVEVRASAEVLLRLLWHRADPEAEGVDPRRQRPCSRAP